MRIKGFDKNLCCKGYQFEIGKEYKIETDKELSLCSDTVFHYGTSLREVHNFYSCKDSEHNRFCEIEVLGEELTDGLIWGSNHIKIIREIVGAELETLKCKSENNIGLFNAGDYNNGYANSGRYNVGNENSGFYNTGFRNTGFANCGGWNAGNENIGSDNTGTANYGDCNVGKYNCGDFNVGCWNKSNYSNGFFNTKEPTIYLFNKKSKMTYSEFAYSKYYIALMSKPFVLTEWIKYSDEEKEKDPQKKLIGGYLKTYTYEEACANWWKSLTTKNKQIIMKIPNFDKKIFKGITGIDVDKGITGIDVDKGITGIDVDKGITGIDVEGENKDKVEFFCTRIGTNNYYKANIIWKGKKRTIFNGDFPSFVDNLNVEFGYELFDIDNIIFHEIEIEIEIE